MVDAEVVKTKQETLNGKLEEKKSQAWSQEWMREAHLSAM